MFEGRRAKDVIIEGWLETYENERDALYRELIELNSTIFTLAKIENFPFSLFIPFYDDRIFWHITRNALIERVIMIAWRIIIDSDPKALTLRRFRDDIRKNSHSKGILILEETLKQLDFEQRMSELERKIIYARHNYLAHYNYKLNIDLTNPPMNLQLNLDDFKNIIEVVRELFDALCFTHRHSLWLWGYSENYRIQERTDIDKMLDLLAERSVWLKMPEVDPELWEENRAKLSEFQLKQFNLYRAKFGLELVE